jgi:hypothetical protein
MKLLRVRMRIENRARGERMALFRVQSEHVREERLQRFVLQFAATGEAGGIR